MARIGSDVRYNMRALRLLTRRSSQHNMEFLMYRMFKTLPSVATACVLAATFAACNGSPSAPSSERAAGGSTTEAGPNGETLKVPAPSLASPGQRPQARHPQTDARRHQRRRASSSAARYSYEFELLTDGNTRIDGATLPSGSGHDHVGIPHRPRARHTLPVARTRPVGKQRRSVVRDRRFITVFEKRHPTRSVRRSSATRLPQ